MTLYEKPLWPTATGVVTAHLILILFMLLFTPSKPLAPIKPKEKLVVRTLKLEPKVASAKPLPKVAAPPPPQAPEPVAMEEEEPTPEPEPEPEPTPPPKPKPHLIKKASPKPPPKPPAAKPVVKKATPKPASKPKPVVKKATPKKTTPPAPPKPDPKVEAAKKKKQELFARAQGTLAKMNKKEAPSSPVASLDQVKIPSHLGSLAVDSLHFDDPSAGLTIRERSYREELASRLKLLLKLPEYGLVKLKLTLSRAGKVIKVDVLSSESALNRSHIQKTLPSLSFPSFGDNFGSESSHTFQITLSSD